MIWEGDCKHWIVTRIDDSGLEPARVYGYPADGWKCGEPKRESYKPIGVEPDEYVLEPGDVVERFLLTGTRFGQRCDLVVCKPVVS